MQDEHFVFQEKPFVLLLYGLTLQCPSLERTRRGDWFSDSSGLYLLAQGRGHFLFRFTTRGAVSTALVSGNKPPWAVQVFTEAVEERASIFKDNGTTADVEQGCGRLKLRSRGVCRGRNRNPRSGGFGGCRVQPQRLRI